MSKVYMINDEDIQDLFDKLELHKFRGNVQQDDYDKPATLQQVHRSFNYVVRRWLDEIGYKP